jgi:hypothetical protein
VLIVMFSRAIKVHAGDKRLSYIHGVDVTTAHNSGCGRSNRGYSAAGSGQFGASISIWVPSRNGPRNNFESTLENIVSVRNSLCGQVTLDQAAHRAVFERKIWTECGDTCAYQVPRFG